MSNILNATVTKDIELIVLAQTAEELVTEWLQTNYLEKNNMILHNCHNQNDPIHLKIAMYKVFPEESKTAVIELFKQFMLPYYDKSNDKYSIYQYWDYNDNINHLIDKIMKDSDHTLTFEQNLSNYLHINELFDDELDFHHHWNKFIKKYPKYENDDFYDNCSSWYYDNVSLDENLKQLINNSKPEELVFYFGKNWDDDYQVENSWTDFKNDNPQSKEDLTSLEGTQMGWLIKTQGYQIKDLFDLSKRQSSKFLQSVYSELYEYVTSLEGMQLIAMPDSTNFEAIYQIHTQKSGIIKKDTTFGLFNRIHGSASGLGIKIEKDIILNQHQDLYRITYSNIKNHYDYSPDAVCGLIRTSEEQLDTYNT